MITEELICSWLEISGYYIAKCDKIFSESSKFRGEKYILRYIALMKAMSHAKCRNLVWRIERYHSVNSLTTWTKRAEQFAIFFSMLRFRNAINNEPFEFTLRHVKSERHSDGYNISVFKALVGPNETLSFNPMVTTVILVKGLFWRADVWSTNCTSH